MTLPAEYQLPLDKSLIESDDPADRFAYQQNLIKRLEEMYRELSVGSNGSFEFFTPVLKDTATASTYTYGNTNGIYIRRNLLVDYWFDVTWTAIATGTPSGNLYVELPYKAYGDSSASTDWLKPYVGTIQTSTFAYGAGMSTIVINAIPGTFRGEIWQCGSAVTSINLPANTAAGQLIGSISYVGEEFE